MEGIAPAIIENVGRQCGMPMGPLEVSDSRRPRYRAEDRQDQRPKLTQQDYKKDPRGALLSWIVEEKGRVGRKAGKGFYEYGEDGKPTRIWPELSEQDRSQGEGVPAGAEAGAHQALPVPPMHRSGALLRGRRDHRSARRRRRLDPGLGLCALYRRLRQLHRSVLGHEEVRRRSRSPRRRLRRTLPPPANSCATWPKRTRASTSASARRRRRRLKRA